MNWLGRLFKRRERTVEAPKTFVMDVEWHRSEELRTDRLGPQGDDVPDPERVRLERWRPERGLGPLP